MPPTDSTTGISAALLQRIRAALLRCPTLQSQAELAALFADARLAPWKHRVHQVGTVASRVELVTSQMHDQWTVGSENALVLLLRVLSDATQPGDGLREELAMLAVALAGGDAGAMLPHDPEARLAAMPTDRVPEVSRSLPVGSRMPLRPNPLFVGRGEELLALARVVKGENGAAVLFQSAGTGREGGGKSQLAAEFCHRYGMYFAGGVFWLNFAEAEGIRAEIAASGAALHPDFQGLSLDKQVQLVLADWEQPIPRLLVFDNCEEEALFTEWRPRTGGCRVLVTSRWTSWSPILGVQQLPLGVLERVESVALLAGYRPDLAEEPVLAEIAEEVGDLPLALYLAGSYLAAYQGGDLGDPVQYLGRLRDNGLLGHPSLQEHGATLSPAEHELHVGRTFALSYDRLDAAQRVDERVLQLLRCAAYFSPGSPIPCWLLLAMLEAGNDKEAHLEVEAGLRQLLALGLLEEAAAASIVLHQMVARFVPRVTGGEAVQKAVETGLLAEANRLNDARSPAPLLVWQCHLRHATNRAKERADEGAAALCNALGIHLYMIGDHTGARPYLERALAIRESVLGAQHLETAQTLNSLGHLLYATGDYVRARSCYERALAIHEAVLGRQHPETATSLNNLGVVLEASNTYGEARTCYERALAIREAVLGEQHPETATSLNNLGALLQTIGDYTRARPYLERALAIREEILGPQHPHTATSLNNLGALLKATGDYTGTRPYYERALAICEAVLGPQHPYTAQSLNSLGALLYAMGDYSAAQPYVARALAICETVLGPQHPETAQILNSKGVLLKATREYGEARTCYERALTIREAVLGGQHPDTATSLNNLGALLQAMGDYEGARPYYERALAICEAVLGPQHPHTATSLHSVAGLLYATGEYATARPYLERALTIYETSLGPTHPTTQILRRNLDSLMNKLRSERSWYRTLQDKLASFWGKLSH